MILDGLPDLYGLKYESVTACGLPLYLCSYKLVGSTTQEKLYLKHVCFFVYVNSKIKGKLFK